MLPKDHYSHLSNKRKGWNKHGGGTKIAKLINVEVGINVEGVQKLRTLAAIFQYPRALILQLLQSLHIYSNLHVY